MILMKHNNVKSGELDLSKVVLPKMDLKDGGDLKNWMLFYNHFLRWEESLRILGNERVQIMNEYSSLSLRSNDERSCIYLLEGKYY